MISSIWGVLTLVFAVVVAVKSVAAVLFLVLLALDIDLVTRDHCALYVLRCICCVHSLAMNSVCRVCIQEYIRKHYMHIPSQAHFGRFLDLVSDIAPNQSGCRTFLRQEYVESHCPLSICCGSRIHKDYMHVYIIQVYIVIIGFVLLHSNTTVILYFKCSRKYPQKLHFRWVSNVVLVTICRTFRVYTF